MKVFQTSGHPVGVVRQVSGRIPRATRHVVRSLAIACALLTGLGAAAGPTSAVAAPGEENCAEPGEIFPGIPWAQALLAPERVWPFTRGGGITIAVLSSGVDAGHPQLVGRVAPGFDAVADGGTAESDCLGLGTQVAGVIAAKPVDGVGFAGLAPDARILPVRVVPQKSFGSAEVDPVVLARGIDWAIANGAQIINVAVAVYSDNAMLRASITNALARKIPVVAAVGDRGDANDGNPTPYPAAYAGVVGVGAIDQEGSRWAGSAHGDYVDLVAPGAQMVTLQRVSGMAVDVTGTGMASGQVAATAALIRARWGDLRPKQIAGRLAATSIPAAVGPDLGRGIVNPYAAINDTVVDASPVSLPALTLPHSERTSAWAGAREVAVAGTVTAAIAVLAVFALAAALPRGRRRFWRSGLAAPPPCHTEPPEPGPPVMLFDEQPPR